MIDPCGSIVSAKVSTRRGALAIPVSRNASKTKPAKLLAVFVVDTDNKELTTLVK
jgi:hypothetical protein